MEHIPVPKDLEIFINTHTHFYLIPHMEPDGDCIGSTLALGHFLSRIGKSISYHNVGPFDKKEVKHFSGLFAPIIDVEDMSSKPNPAAIILDCSTLDRIGELAEDINGLPIAVMDHHSSGEEFGDVRFINTSAPACSLLVQQLIETMGYMPDAEESELIFYAFATDTGFFRHLDHNSSLSFEYISRLIGTGASPRDTFMKLTGGKTLDSRHYLGELLVRTESYLNGKILLTWENKDDLSHYGKENRDSDSLFQLLLSVEGTEVAISLREEDSSTCTGSLRSKSNINVGKICQKLGGGGHAKAAGFMQKSNLEETKSKVLSLVINACNQSTKTS